ncbi:MAG: hypothetical protein ACOX1L_00975 [Erysipelotrichaceae bacterium]
MKKIFTMLLVVIMVLGLAGCELPWFSPSPSPGPGPEPKPDPDPEPTDSGLTLQELWDYLDDYPCYLSDNGLDDYVVVFDDDHNITIDNFNVLEKESINYYFNMLDSFNYEGDNVYKLEYINTYSDRFNNGTFFIKFNEETKDKIEVGMYFNNTLDFFELRADTGMSLDQLLSAIRKYEWLQEKELLCWFIRIYDNEFSHGIVASSYWFYGPVAKLNYLVKFMYQITIDYPAKEEGINPANDAYTTTHLLFYDPVHERIRFINHDDNYCWYYPDTGATIEEFFAANDGYKFVGQKNINYIFYKDNGKYYVYLKNTKYNISNTLEVKSIKYEQYNQYEFVVLNGSDTEIWKIEYNINSGYEMSINKPNLIDYAQKRKQ